MNNIKMKNNIFSLFVIGMFCALSLQQSYAQDAIFSQFYNNPVYNNPAFAGVHNGRFRIVSAFKDQWNAVSNTKFQTSHVSIDMRSKIGKADFLTYGFSGTNDQTGSTDFTVNSAGYFAGYMKQLSGSSSGKINQYLSGGFNLSIGQISIDPHNLWFSNQFDPTTISVDRSIDSGEDIRFASKFFPDLSAGILYYGVNGDNSYYLGLAGHHINKPDISLISNNEVSRYSRYSIQAGGQIAISNTTQLLPAFIWHTQGPAMSLTTGLNIRHSNNDWNEVAIRFGSYLSFAKNIHSGIYMPWLNTAFIMELKAISLGVSYDMSIGTLAVPTDSRGALELTIGYVKPASFKEPIKCPKL
jgi:type IX secretion system PorP/SprF family membrane protein